MREIFFTDYEQMLEWIKDLNEDLTLGTISPEEYALVLDQVRISPEVKQQLQQRVAEYLQEAPKDIREYFMEHFEEAREILAN